MAIIDIFGYFQEDSLKKQEKVSSFSSYSCCHPVFRVTEREYLIIIGEKKSIQRSFTSRKSWLSEEVSELFIGLTLMLAQYTQAHSGVF